MQGSPERVAERPTVQGLESEDTTRSDVALLIVDDDASPALTAPPVG